MIFDVKFKIRITRDLILADEIHGERRNLLNPDLGIPSLAIKIL